MQQSDVGGLSGVIDGISRAVLKVAMKNGLI